MPEWVTRKAEYLLVFNFWNKVIRFYKSPFFNEENQLYFLADPPHVLKINELLSLVNCLNFLRLLLTNFLYLLILLVLNPLLTCIARLSVVCQ